MKKPAKVAAIAALLMAFLVATSLSAQEWTEDQQEVWKVVEDMWSKWKANDIDGTFDRVHEDYLGWNRSLPMPTSKAKWQASMKKYSEVMHMQDYDIEPARINVERNTAVIHYYYSYSYMLDMGDEKKKIRNEGRWTAFMIMEKDLWMLIGDFSSLKEEDDD